MIRVFWVIGLVFGALAMAVPVPAYAQESRVLNCDTLPALEGNRRYVPELEASASSWRAETDGEQCILWPQSTSSLQIYRPVPGASTDPTRAEQTLRSIKSAVELSLQRYRDNGFMNTRAQPPIHLWLIKSAGDAAASTDALDSTSPCVINVYLPEIYGYGSDEFHQILAHELFHCVQISQINQPYIPSTYWWMEGSAEWASAIVYPSVNAEYESTVHYHQHELLFDQCDPGLTGNCGTSLGIYATALFFQDMANQQGNAAVFDLLLRMPTFSGGEAQRQAFSDAPGIDEVFEKFTQDYIDGKIKDHEPNGGYMAQPKAILSQTFDINESRKITNITIQGTPLMIYAYKVNFPKGKSYVVTGLESKDNFRFSFRNGDEQWQSGDSSEPVEIKAACSKQTGIISLSSAENVSESKTFSIEIEASDDFCECTCVEPVPQCVKGNWKSTEAPQLDMFVNAINGLNKTGRDSVSFENGSANVDQADLRLTVGQGGDFTSSTMVDYHGGGTMSGQEIDMQGSIRSKAQGHVCLTADRQLCMQFKAEILPTVLQISAMGMTLPIPSPGSSHEGSITLPYTCSASALTLQATVPMDPPVDLNIRYHR